MKIKAAIIALLVWITCMQPMLAWDNPMKGPGKQAAPPVQKTESKMGEGFVITAYQKVLSPVGGARCRMHPSCSRYCQQCLSEHGLLRGYIMTCDRLLRCGRDELSHSATVWVHGKKKCHDSVSENSIWQSKGK